jgi:hypothetical protein
MGTRSRLAATVLSTLLVAGCTGGDDDAVAVSTTLHDPTTTTTTSPAATSSSPSTSTTTTTLPPTTTTAPGTATVAATCATLQTASWPDRRAVILVSTAAYQAEGGAGALVDPVRAMCSDDLARQEAAVAMEQRMTTTRTGLDEQWQTSYSSSGCQDGNIVTTYTNNLAEPVGLIVGAFAYTSDDTPISAVDNVSIVWSMTPSQALLLTIPYGGRGACAWFSDNFLGDTGPADAALPGGPGPATTGDDPAVWLPALIQAILDTRSAPTEAGWAGVEDARLLRPLDRSLEPATDIHPLMSATVCPGTVDQPDADHIAFAYRAEYGPSEVDGVDHAAFATLSFNAFRRGSDGRWRMLTSPIALNGSLMAADCGPVVPHEG